MRVERASGQVERFAPIFIVLAVLAMLAAVYLLTLQRDVSQLGHEYLVDVGEVQIALNLRGTIHYTGYPLYTMLGAAMVALFRAVGVNPAASASLVSMVFGLAALGVVYALLVARELRPVLAAVLVLVLGLTQSYWIHSVVAEVYSFWALLVALALWWVLKDERAWQRRDWLIAALILGLGFGHHRAAAFLVPGLAVWLLPRVWYKRRAMPGILAPGALVFAATFAVYLYLPARDLAGARWVYGQPGIWDGFWDQFFGWEAGGFAINPPQSLADLGTHARFVLDVLVAQLWWPGLLLSALCLLMLLARRASRHYAAALLVGMAAYLAFAVWLPEAVLAPAFLMPVSMLCVLAVGEVCKPFGERRAFIAALGVGLLWAGALLWINGPFVRDLTGDTMGRETIEQISALPRDAFSREPVLLVPWGGAYFAINYGRYVTGELDGFTPVDHRADVSALAAEGVPLLTLPETFYTLPPAQWERWLGAFHLSSVAPGIVQVGGRPVLAVSDEGSRALQQMDNGMSLLDYELVPGDGVYRLALFWRADRRPDVDYSVFVHLARTDAPAGPDDILAQYDVTAPVYNWYPTTRWRAGEVVRDDYLVTPPAGYAGPLYLRVGMYHRLADGSFENFEALGLVLRD